MALLSEYTGPPYREVPFLWDAFQSTVDNMPDHLALGCVHQPADLFGVSSLALDDDSYRQNPYLRWTFRDIHTAVHCLITAWRRLGVEEGNLIVTFAQNSVEWVLAAWAAIKIGCKIMPISPRNLTNEEEVRHMVATALLAAGSDVKQVILAGTDELAKIMDELNIFPRALKIVIDGVGSPGTGWMPFKDLVVDEQQDITEALEMAPSDEGGTILFTSGTTSLPKGVYMSFKQSFSRVIPGIPKGQQGALRPGAVMCHVMPNNHAMGWAVLTTCLMMGTAVVIPGQAFEPASMLDTLYAEKTTHIIVVPTMIYALVAAKSTHTKYAHLPLSHLEDVMMGGSGVTTEHLRLITEELGATGVENFYGCTEGLMVGSGCASASEIKSIVDGEDVSVGWPVFGYRVKVVDPETGETVPRNVRGEIHGYGWCMPEPYIGGVGKDTWYSDEKAQRWYKTGDQGRMDEQGRLFIMGRYKEMIIRGGENISPGAIEAILSKHPLLSPLLPQIVGAKDSIAGEVPVAVIKGNVTAEIRDLIQTEVVQHMGALYVPEDVISIEDLGLQDFPRTTSGKVQKTKIKSLLDEYMSKPAATSDIDTTEQIRTIWAKAVGLDPSHLRLDAPIAGFADSITIMRVREKIRKQTGKALSLTAMAQAETIEKQIQLLQSMEAPSKETQKTRVDRPRRQGGPEVDDIAHLTENPDLFVPTKELVVKTISKYGFGWEDVEDIMPAYDFVAIMSKTRLFESWIWDFAMRPTAQLDKTQLRRAFEAVVINHRLLASFLVWNTETQEYDDVLHVVMKQSSKFFDLIIEDGGDLETIEDLRKIPETHPHPNWVSSPEPMYRAMLYNIKETGGAALAVSANHSIMDASMMQLIHEDLDRALTLAAGNITTEAIVSQLPAHVDYKVWTDSYFNLRTSSEARAATKWHVKRLSSIAEHVKAANLLPSQSPTPTSSKPASFQFDVPEIHKLRKEHPNITPTVLVKAAMALMEVDRTGYSHAVFCNLEAARTYFPFLPKSMIEHASGSHHFEGTDVSGPAFQIVFNVVEVDRSAKETVLAFLERMQEEQTALTKFASAPMLEIMKELDKISPGSGELVPQLVNTPQFNWVPGLGQSGTDPFPSVKMVNAVSKPTTRLTIHAGLGGEKNQTVFVNVYGGGTGDRDDAAQLGEKTVAITKWLATSGNWTSPVAEFTDSLRGL